MLEEYSSVQQMISSIHSKTTNSYGSTCLSSKYKNLMIANFYGTRIANSCWQLDLVIAPSILINYVSINFDNKVGKNFTSYEVDAITTWS